MLTETTLNHLGGAFLCLPSGQVENTSSCVAFEVWKSITRWLSSVVIHSLISYLQAELFPMFQSFFFPSVGGSCHKTPARTSLLGTNLEKEIVCLISVSVNIIIICQCPCSSKRREIEPQLNVNPPKNDSTMSGDLYHLLGSIRLIGYGSVLASPGGWQLQTSCPIK